jgi:cytochrome c-type biogenesis protein
MSTLFDGTHLSFIVIYLAGFTTFFASCLLPLVPTYLAYLAGLTALESSQDPRQKTVRMVQGSLYFVLGFLIVFVTLGLSLNVLNNRVFLVKLVLEKIGGLLFITLGLMLLKLVKVEALLQNHEFWGVQWMRHRVQGMPWQTQAVVAGMGFAASWSPCIGPVLAAVLYWSVRSTVLTGMAMLITYGVGMGTPFILVSLLYQFLQPRLKGVGVWSERLNTLSAIVLVIAGALMLVGQFQFVSVWVLTVLHLNTLAL